MALGCERVEKMLEDWEHVLVAANCTIYVLPDSAGKERDLTGPGAPKLEMYYWSTFDRLSEEPPCMQGVYIGSHPPLDYAVTRGANEKT